jgi:hypothetical protein
VEFPEVPVVDELLEKILQPHQTLFYFGILVHYALPPALWWELPLAI